METLSEVAQPLRVRVCVWARARAVCGVVGVLVL